MPPRGSPLRRPNHQLYPPRTTIHLSSSDSYTSSSDDIPKRSTTPSTPSSSIRTSQSTFAKTSPIQRKVTIMSSSDSFGSDSEKKIPTYNKNALLQEISSDDDHAGENPVVVESSEIVDYSPYQETSIRQAQSTSVITPHRRNDRSFSSSDEHVSRPRHKTHHSSRHQQFQTIHSQKQQHNTYNENPSNELPKNEASNNIQTTENVNPIPTNIENPNNDQNIQKSGQRNSNLENRKSTLEEQATDQNQQIQNDSDTDNLPDETDKRLTIGKPNEQLFLPRALSNADTLPCMNIGWNKSFGHKNNLHMTFNDRVVYYSREAKTEIGRCHLICTDTNLNRYSNSYVGSLKKSANLSRFTLFVPAGEEHQTRESEIMGIAFYDYKDETCNKVFRGRTFRLAMPKTFPYFPANKEMNLSRLAMREIVSDDILLFRSKLPTEIGNNKYRLDFGNVYVVSSIKNFVIENDDHQIIFMIYKSANGICSVRFAAPFNSLMAFGLAIAIITSQR